MQLLRNRSGLAPAIIVFLAALLFPVVASAEDEEVDPAAEAVGFQTRLEAHFIAEEVDAEWAPGIEEGFRENVRSAAVADRESVLATVEIRTFACRATTCRIEATLPSEGDFRTLMVSLNEIIPWDHTAEWFLVSSEPAVMVGYISREGAEILRDRREPSMQ